MTTGTYTPSGLKTKTVILHAATTTITKVKVDHTKRTSLTRTPFLSVALATHRISVWGWGRGMAPTPQSQTPEYTSSTNIPLQEGWSESKC